MADVVNQTSNIYEGNEPYLFISYSHRDYVALEEVKALFDKNRIRYWYDDGLHSGDDWNMVIAKRLQSATVCLLLLSPNSAISDYVKNELTFAMSHRIPIHTLLVEDFTLPLDIDMMTGRIQRILMQGEYSAELLDALPAEVVITGTGNPLAMPVETKHPLFQREEELWERQGTKNWLGRHKTLQYPCLISVETIKPADKTIAQTLSTLAAGISHPVFPKIIDTEILADQMRTYQLYRKEEFLDQYLQNHTLDQETIISWILSVLDAMEMLLRQNLGLRDLSRGSLMVVDEKHVGISRLQNPYYGLIRFQTETKSYYFDRELQEIGILLFQLCTGKSPSLPLRLITEKRFDKHFLEKINLVIQKCVKEKGKTQYSDFSQIKQDLNAAKISREDKKFLQRRKALLEEYEARKAQRTGQFTGERAATPGEILMPVTGLQPNVEREFGFEETVTLGGSQTQDPWSSGSGTPQIRLMICSTGEVMDFHKTTVRIGKDNAACDMVWTQPYVSRQHAIIRKLPDGTYAVTDLNTTNGTYVISESGSRRRIGANEEAVVFTGTIVEIGTAQIKIL